MTYTITLERKIERNTIDSLLVLITKDPWVYLVSWQNLVKMFKSNKTYIRSDEFNNEETTRLYIEYSFTKEE